MRLPRIKSCDRVEFILNHADGKSVLHIGCSDMPFTEYKIKRETLLHQRIAKVTNDLTGVDLSHAGIQLMRDAGIPQVYSVDAETDLFNILEKKYDVVIVGEVLEHVLNPGMFLNSIRSVCHKQSIVLITTPNNAPLKRLPRLIFRNEVVHPDHLYYFSYSTLSALFNKCNYNPIEWHVYWRDVGILSIIINKLLRRISFFQYFADGFCVLCTV